MAKGQASRHVTEGRLAKTWKNSCPAQFFLKHGFATLQDGDRTFKGKLRSKGYELPVCKHFPHRLQQRLAHTSTSQSKATASQPGKHHQPKQGKG